MTLDSGDRLALLRTFLEDAKERVRKIDAGLTKPDPDLDALALDAHTLIGAAAVVNLPTLAGGLRLLEESLAAGDVPGARSRLAVVMDELAAVREQRRVLAIEDDPTNRLLLERAAGRTPGVELVLARDGETGLRLARESPPDLVLLDLRLPGVSGEEVLRRLQADEMTRPIPVVVVSADASPELVEALVAAGAFQYLTKPFDLERLMRLMAGET